MKWNLVNFCEYDKFAVKSYCAIHNVLPTLNLGDITKIDENSIADFDLMTWGFPCTDISIAGNQKGFIDVEGNKTRSGLYYDGLRMLKAKQPKFSIIENVAALIQIKFKKEYRRMFKDLDEAGYNSYAEVLNSKYYGIPQNRERVFIVSIRKDIDKGYTFPQPFYKKMSIKDIKLDVVDEKYYVSNDIIEKMANSNFMQEKLKLQIGNICSTLMARDYKDPKLVYANEVKQVGNIVDSGNWDNPQRGRIYSADGCSPALNTCGGGGLAVKIVDISQIVTIRKYDVDIENLKVILKTAKTKSKLSNKTIAKILDKPVTLVEHWFRNDDCFSIPDADRWQDLKRLLNISTYEFDESIMTFEQKQGVFEKSNRHYLESGISPTLTCGDGEKIITEERIRKLTPQEYFRLMGFDDADYYQAQAVNSDSQLYKQCGNSIVVNVLYYIFKKLQERYAEHFEDLRVSSFFSGVGAFEKALDRLQAGWEEPIEAKEIQEQISLF